MNRGAAVPSRISIFAKKILGGPIGSQVPIRIVIATVANGIGRLANVLIPLLIITVYGINARTDELLLILTIAYFFYGTIGNAITDAAVPSAADGSLGFNTSKQLKISISITLVAIVLTAHFSTQNAFYNALAATGVGLMVCAGIYSAFMSAHFYANNKYVLPAASWLLRIAPIAIYWFTTPPSEALAWLVIGIGIADCARALALRLSVNPACIRKPAAEVAPSTRRYLAVLLATIIAGVNPIVSRIVADRAGPGALSLFDTAERIYGVVASLGTMGITAVILSQLSRAHQEDRLAPQWYRVVRLSLAWGALWLGFALILHVTAIPWFLSGYSRLTAAEIQILTDVYLYLALGLPALVLSISYSRHALATGAVHSLVPTALLSVALNYSLSSMLQPVFQLSGVAIGATASYALALGFLVWSTEKKRASR